jgi:hypothetical protein
VSLPSTSQACVLADDITSVFDHINIVLKCFSVPVLGEEVKPVLGEEVKATLCLV